MARARGANAVLAAKFETAYATPPVGNWMTLPFVSSNLGEERGLIESDLLGQGREPQDPTPDVANDVGDVVVPVDARAFGNWLKLMLADPASGAGDAAAGAIVFSAQPAADETITINGNAFTFKAAGAVGSQINIGVDLAATLAAIAAKLNASAIAQVAEATYTADATTLTIVHDAAGVGGNAFTLAASAGSHGTVSGATLTGGNYQHVFTTGEEDLPSMSIEVGLIGVAKPYSVHIGVRGNTLKISMARSGLLNATMSLIARGELDASPASSAGAPTDYDIARFAQASGFVKRSGTLLGEIVSADITLTNNLETIDVIRPDGRIEDADPGMVMLNVSLVVKYADTGLKDAASDGTPVELEFGWTNAVGSLLIEAPRVFLPKVKNPITGPKGIQATYNGQGSGISGGSATVTLKNDVADY